MPGPSAGAFHHRCQHLARELSQFGVVSEIRIVGGIEV
jgi:hypothetical protein